ncbi:MAG: pyridoxal phosphate-dependent aminotransferase [Chloroflexi bacterium]|nr:pyridoxal phosphate-dependent aminotransferase [Chloroflexota bacterium]
MPKPQIAARIASIPPSGVAEMMRLGREMEQRGEEVIYLVQGEPDFDTPPHIIEAAREAMARGFTHYVPGEGLLELREAVAEKLARENDIQADPKSEILITTGATMGLYAAVMAVVDPGDEVLLTDPAYGPYEAMVGLAGGRVVFVPLMKSDRGFYFVSEEFESRVTPRTKAIVINTPNNPTGKVMTRAELEMLGELAQRHDLIIIADEVYEKLVYDGRQHVSIAALAPEFKARTIVVNSFSKTYAMTGWRLGYNVANSALTSAMTKVIYQSGRCATAFVQRAGIVALRESQDRVRQMFQAYLERRRLMTDLLATIPGVSCPSPEGTFYVFPDVSSFGMGTWDLAKYLLNEVKVVTTPGRYYGVQGEGHLRLSFATSTANIRLGINRIGHALERLWR